MTIDELNDALKIVWCAETAYSGDKKNWSTENKSVGQCTVTAIIVWDYFGGKIVRGYSEKYKLLHYWNEIDGKKVDLTYAQFLENKNDIFFTDIIYKTKKDLMKINSVKNRYLLLKRRLDDYINNN